MSEYKQYIGVKLVEAFERAATEEDRRGVHPVGALGYQVKYPDGYLSWCPKVEFEKYNRQVSGLTYGMANTVTKEHIDSIIIDEQYSRVIGTTITHCALTLLNGFVVTGESSCVDATIFNKAMGEKYAREKAYEKIWELEGYLLKQKMYEQNQTYTFEEAIKLLDSGKTISPVSFPSVSFFKGIAGPIYGTAAGEEAYFINRNNKIALFKLEEFVKEDKYIVV